MLTDALVELGARVGERLKQRGETIGVAEGSCGGLVSAALLAAPGASRYYRGGAVIYTGAAVRGLLAPNVSPPDGLRGASEPFVRYLAEAIATSVRSTWGVGEGGATGPEGNPYGDPPGHCWIGVAGPVSMTRHLLTGRSGRTDNMAAFATAALELVLDALDSTPTG